MITETIKKYKKEWAKKKYHANHEFRKKMLKNRRIKYATNSKFREQQKEYANTKYIADLEYRKKSDENRRRRHGKAPWLSHFYGMKQRCTYPSRKDYKYYGGRGIRMLLTEEEVELLYKRDHASQMERPSLDRINPNGNYHFGNCQFIELSENISRAQKRRRLNE